MSRARVIYQSDAVFVGPNPGTATGAHMASGTIIYGDKGSQMSGQSLVDQLTRIQSANWSASVTRQDVNQWGELAAIDRVILEQPTVSLDLSWLVSSLANEKYIGLSVTPTGQTYAVTCVSGILTDVSDERNYFIVQAGEGLDANNNSTINTAGTTTYAFGSMFLSSYNTSASVGGFPTTSIRLEGSNYVVQTGTQGNAIPAVFPTDGTRVSGWFYSLPNATSSPDPGSGDLTISALRPGDITVSITNSGDGSQYSELGATPSSVSGALQGYSFSYDLRREALQKLGTAFAYSKEVTYPLQVNGSVNGLVTDMNTGALETIICNDKAYNIEVNIKKPGCEANRPVVAKYRLLNAKIDNQQYSLSIGSNKTFSYDFSAQIGSPQQLTQGFFLSGVIGN